MHWLRDGDSNTRYFHFQLLLRKKIKIQKLMNSSGEMVVDQSGLCELAHEYFVDLFNEQEVNVTNVVNEVPVKLGVAENEALLRPFSDEEFRMATFQMHPAKCPGPDGMNPGFYRHFWQLCGKGVIAACRS